MYLRFTDKDFFQGKGQNLVKDRLQGEEGFIDIRSFTFYGKGDQGASVFPVENIKAAEGFPLINMGRQHALQLVDAQLHVIQILMKKDAAFVQKSHMIADILKLS